MKIHGFARSHERTRGSSSSGWPRVQRVGIILFQARYILISLVFLFAIGVAIGVRTAPAVVSGLSKEILTPAVAGPLEPVFFPNITYRKYELLDRKLVLRTGVQFLHNAVVIGLLFYAGSLITFIPPLLILFHGWVAGALFRQAGWQMSLHRTIPHGPIEVSVLLCAAAVATKLGLDAYKTLLKRDRSWAVHLLKDATSAYLLCLPWLLVSALLENYGTRLLWGT